jgi:hypothetical protein
VTRSVRHDCVVLVFAVVDRRSSPDHPLGHEIETSVRREDAEQEAAARAPCRPGSRSFSTPLVAAALFEPMPLS